ncbi:helix-turn-helix domain-containing protein [Marinobacter salicampi]|uniref:helix-turn-helix domain-containing protein n=1 Tax=Marinobacter salicampi TaxID=435907 RepID=UPI0014095090|nr:helix-turn-helix transcriptional regulator [Marinobacter salicampi]
MTLGATLRSFRKAKGLTLTELATQAHSHEGNLSRIERDAAKPSLDLLYRLADSLNVSVNELFQVSEVSRSGDGQSHLNANFIQLAPSDRSLLVDFSNLLQKSRSRSE